MFKCQFNNLELIKLRKTKKGADKRLFIKYNLLLFFNKLTS